MKVRKTSLVKELRRIRRATKDGIDKSYLTWAINTLVVYFDERQRPDVMELERTFRLQDTRE